MSYSQNEISFDELVSRTEKPHRLVKRASKLKSFDELTLIAASSSQDVSTGSVPSQDLQSDAASNGSVETVTTRTAQTGTSSALTATASAPTRTASAQHTKTTTNKTESVTSSGSEKEPVHFDKLAYAWKITNNLTKRAIETIKK
jgi:hypothetical protein